jgi:hypothetical protein
MSGLVVWGEGEEMKYWRVWELGPWVVLGKGEEVLNEILDEVMRWSPGGFGLRATGLRMYWTGKGDVQKESIAEIPFSRSTYEGERG